MKDRKYIKTFEEKASELNISDISDGEIIDDMEYDSDIMNYKEGIKKYDIAISYIDEIYSIFINTPWGLPEEFERVFGENQGNETLENLKKEVERLKSK